MSGLLDKLQGKEEISILADCGFTIEDQLDKLIEHIFEHTSILKRSKTVESWRGKRRPSNSISTHTCRTYDRLC